MIKKLKREDGFTGTDITVAIIIILLFMSLISVLFFNITKSAKAIERKDEATFIATEVIEEIKIQNYDQVKVTRDLNSEEVWEDIKLYTYENGHKIVNVEGDPDSGNIQLEDGYTCKVDIQNFIPEGLEEEQKKDLVKVVQVKVEYKIGGKVEEVKLKTTILKE